MIQKAQESGIDPLYQMMRARFHHWMEDTTRLTNDDREELLRLSTEWFPETPENARKLAEKLFLDQKINQVHGEIIDFYLMQPYQWVWEILRRNPTYITWYQDFIKEYAERFPAETETLMGWRKIPGAIDRLEEFGLVFPASPKIGGREFSYNYWDSRLLAGYRFPQERRGGNLGYDIDLRCERLIVVDSRLASAKQLGKLQRDKRTVFTKNKKIVIENLDEIRARRNEIEALYETDYFKPARYDYPIDPRFQRAMVVKSDLGKTDKEDREKNLLVLDALLEEIESERDKYTDCHSHAEQQQLPLQPLHIPFYIKAYDLKVEKFSGKDAYEILGSARRLQRCGEARKKWEEHYYYMAKDFLEKYTWYGDRTKKIYTYMDNLEKVFGVNEYKRFLYSAPVLPAK